MPIHFLRWYYGPDIQRPLRAPVVLTMSLILESDIIISGYQQTAVQSSCLVPHWTCTQTSHFLHIDCIYYYLFLREGVILALWSNQSLLRSARPCVIVLPYNIISRNNMTIIWHHRRQSCLHKMMNKNYGHPPIIFCQDPIYILKPNILTQKN